MKQNLAQYEYFSREAETASADIVVFPEDGLTGFEFLDPEYFHPFLQHVPDNYFGWNPCLLPGISYFWGGFERKKQKKVHNGSKNSENKKKYGVV